MVRHIFRYLGITLNVENVYFGKMVSQIYHSELKLIKAYTLDTKVAFLDLHLSMFLPKFIKKMSTLILKLSNTHFR